MVRSKPDDYANQAVAIYTHGMMKLPFGRTKVQKIETTIAALVKRGDQLAAKRAKAQEALERATSARQQALLAGDLDDQRALDKLQVAVDSAQSALTGIDDALAILGRQKAEAESALVSEREHAERIAVGDALEKQVAAIEAAAGPWLAQSRIYADALAELAHWHFGCDEMSKFLQSCMGQMEAAANFQLTELKGMPEAIREDRQSIPPAKPVPTPVAAVEPPAPTMTTFMLKSARYLDHEGRKRFAGQYEDAVMPVATAQKAMRLGLAVSTADPRRAQLRGSRGGNYRADAIDVIDIDAAEEHGRVSYIGRDKDVIAAANFTEMPRGPDRTGTISVHRV